MKRLLVEAWTAAHNTTEFTSSIVSIQKFIREQAPRVVSNNIATVFVLVEEGDKQVRGYYTLSSQAVSFAELPVRLQKRIPRYRTVGATLLGRLGIDEKFRDNLAATSEEKPRLGEYLLFDAQQKVLRASEIIGSPLMIIDVLEPAPAKFANNANGAKDPMPFYIQYGFVPLPERNRTLYKLVSSIAAEFSAAE